MRPTCTEGMQTMLLNDDYLLTTPWAKKLYHDHAKYLAFVDALQKAPGNPIYEWSHLEPRRVFGIDLQITRANAEEIRNRANALLATPEYHAKGLIW